MTEALILLAAGGTGGHLFPAEALGVVLMQRGLHVRLVTDSRAIQYSGLFSDGMFDVVPSETLRGGSPVALARAAVMLSIGTARALALINRLKPAAVVGFGGYPTLPPLAAAILLHVPTVIHDSNAVLGRANRLLATRVTAIATSLPGVFDRDPGLAGKSVLTGTPLRPAVISAAAQPYTALTNDAPFRLIVFGGSGKSTTRSRSIPSLRRSSPTCRNALPQLTSSSRVLVPARSPSSLRSGGLRFWCRCPARSTRISSPMPAC
jgi:UDP-N-acetylglucosamine--N-acetylmuramyl-(pentapeptide) pyrophosphoryl-undecaprenol N-acetylglucosamine transferase